MATYDSHLSYRNDTDDAGYLSKVLLVEDVKKCW